MKRSTEALVLLEMVAVIVAMAITGLFGVARAQEAPVAALPVVKLRGDAWLAKTTNGSVEAAKFHVHARFATDTPGAPLFTLQRAVIFFPDHAGTNGRLFPSCSVRRIERFHGNVRRCPKGSKIGSGTVKAQALQLGITATGRVTMFNGPQGKSIIFNIQTYLPAYINENIEAPLTQLHGRYGEKLTLVDPPALQEILSGVFIGVEDFDVVTGSAVTVRGVEYSYLKARTCPKHPLHGVFDFVNGTTGQTATVTADAKVRCTVR